MGKNLDRHLTKENTQVASKYMKGYSKSYVIKECKLKQDMTTQIKIQSVDNIKCR